MKTLTIARLGPWLRLLCAAAILGAGCAQGGVALTTLHSFAVYTNGASPDAPLVQGRDGNFYGTTSTGGRNGNVGTVFKISTNGVLTSLYSFSGLDGGGPVGLVQAGDGTFYGATSGGGPADSGTVFRISADGAFTTLYSFTGGNDGGNPHAGLILASDGNLYGTTYSGGTNRDGKVFRISPAGVVTNLHVFTGPDGAYPAAALVEANDGSFYGTTSYDGGAGHFGTVFKITTDGTFTNLHFFSGGSDGGAPFAGLVQGSDGNLYGTTWGPRTYNDFGTVFKISSQGALTTLYRFTGGSDGGSPLAGLIQASDGSFYGTTSVGGGKGYGTIFKISTNGVLTSLYSFAFSDGVQPAGLVQGSDGDLYGVNGGGAATAPQWPGSVFKISTSGAFTSLYSFPGGTDGAVPDALVPGSDGDFYGATSRGIVNGATVFKTSPSGAFTTLYSLTANGAFEPDTLLQGGDGNFYGSANYSDGNAAIAEISSNGTFNTLYSFTNELGGRIVGALVQGSDGNLYGTTVQNFGTVFSFGPLQPPGVGTLSTLYSFSGIDGDYPNVLMQGSDGNFYGTTLRGGPNATSTFAGGTVFQITSGGALTLLYSFSGGADGAAPNSLIQGSDGNFYGTTGGGGTNGGRGTIFKLDTSGVLTSLHSFTGGIDGSGPGGLVQGSDGRFYGITGEGGTNVFGPGYFGTVFKISPDGAFTTSYSFTGGSDGSNPSALVQARDGSFYGTTEGGGLGAYGTVFRLTIAPEVTINLAGVNVVLTWPTNFAGFDYSGYSLQSTTNLGGTTVWSTNLPSPVVVNGQYTVTNPISGAQQFYRLSQ